MKEQIDTIPLNDAFASGDECPFCFLERKAEQGAIRYVAGPGASYMEPDCRAATDKTGFCTCHMKKLYDYGNTLGAALMLQTHIAGLLEELEVEAQHPSMAPAKSLFGKKKADAADSYRVHLQERVKRCYICDKIDYNMNRYYTTFFYMLKDEDFRSKVQSSKGFCLRHFGDLLEQAEEKLPNAHRFWFYNTVYKLTRDELKRVKEDLDWLIAKYDYRNACADWKNSKDALPRAMQKLQGLHPADPAYKQE